jgi:hypothetical protein
MKKIINFAVLKITLPSCIPRSELFSIVIRKVNMTLVVLVYYSDIVFTYCI